MKTEKGLSYRISPHWRVEQQGNSLRLHAGADAEYEVVLPTDAASAYCDPKRVFTRRTLSDSDSSVFEQMFTAGVIDIVGKKQRKAKIAFVGDALPFDLKLPTGFELADDVDDAAVAVVVRYTSTHQQMARKYYDLSTPYVYLDIAYHHTVSVGPLVYSGETVCIGCLYGRLQSRWGDKKPPKSPRAAIYGDFVRTILATELGKITNDDNSLVGKVVAWDIDGRRVTTDTLLKSSLCPQCVRPGSNKPTMVLWS